MSPEDKRNLMADIPDEMERLHQQRRIIDIALRDAVAERDRLLDIATDLWCSLFGTTREVENVAQLTIEQAAMLPGALKGYTIAANEERNRLQARVTWLRQAYGKAWLRRRSMSGIIRDVNSARRSAKTERDRLRAELHGHLATAADAVEAIDAEKADVEAERDRLREHADALDEVVGGYHNDLHAMTAERDRLRAERDEWVGAHAKDSAANSFVVQQLTAERDRLRAVVDALIEWRDAEMRLTTADIVADISDHRDLAETTRQNLWLVLARWEEQLDVSPTGEDA